MSKSFSALKAIPKPASQVGKFGITSYDRDSRTEIKPSYVSHKMVPKLNCSVNSGSNGFKQPGFKSKSPKHIYKTDRKSEKKKESSHSITSKIPVKKKSFNYNYSCTTNDLSLINDMAIKNDFNQNDSSFIDTDKHAKEKISKSASKCQVSQDRKFSILDIQDSNSNNQSPPHSIGKSNKSKHKERLKLIDLLPKINHKCALILAMSR